MTSANADHFEKCVHRGNTGQKSASTTTVVEPGENYRLGLFSEELRYAKKEVALIVCLLCWVMMKQRPEPKPPIKDVSSPSSPTHSYSKRRETYFVFV